jgi:hypothetical protein
MASIREAIESGDYTGWSLEFLDRFRGNEEA